ERAHLTFARLELENLFDDDEDGKLISPKVSESFNYGLWIDPDFDEDEDDYESDQGVDSETLNLTSKSDTSNPTSTSTSIDTPITSVKELYYEKVESPINKSNERRNSTRSSYNEKVESPGNKTNERKNSTRSSAASRPSESNGQFHIHDRSVSDARVIVDSPMPIDERHSLNGLALNDPANLMGKNFRLECEILRDTLERSRSLTQRNLDIINKVYKILDQWENVTDSLLIKRIETLCISMEIKPKDLLTIFEENSSESPDYYFVIGFFNEHAFGKAEDLKAAFENYSKAADFGDSRGEVYLAWCYYKGTGTLKDPPKAFRAFQSAADRGCASAYNSVGWCYDIGFGVASDPVKAFECFKASGEKGYATAQCRVGLCYEYGKGTAKDLEKALEWYTKAAENGLESSRKRANEISKIIAGGGKRRSFLVRNAITIPSVGERVLYGPLRSTTT
ncbi:14704_t:CDS:2, partial [Acaulospora morrowiae]